MKIQLKDWQHKGGILGSVLKKHKVKLVSDHADILLIDYDGDVLPYPMIIEKAYAEGAEVLVYSHGAFSMFVWDGIHAPNAHTVAYLALSEGQKQVMDAYEYPLPVHVIGWHYCEQKPFTATEVRNVLFAPWHPLGNGYLRPDAKLLNTQVFSLLRKLPVTLKVRHANYLEANGLEREFGVEYEHSDMTIESSIKAIDAADVIVSNPGTFAALAIARGKPVVMYGQDLIPAEAYSDSYFLRAKHWDKYREIMRYPYSIEDLKPKAAMIMLEHAAQHEAKEWRELWIGKNVDGKNLLSVLNQYAGGSDD
jgi:hypothetical protein